MAILNPPRRIHRVLTAGLVPAAAAVLLLGGCGGAPAGTASVKESGEPAARTEAENRAASVKVPEATTYTTVRGAPKDPAPDGVTDGLVVNPSTALPVLDRPDGRRIATLPTRQLGGPTWVPVVETSGAWRRVLLPSRPNNATGWISGEGLRTARTPYTVRVDLGRRVLTLAKSGREVGRWRVAIGGAETPTPTGRTFLLATLTRNEKEPSPLVLPLGAHSATLDTFGGGPGTVALHGWPDASVFGKAVTHGCVRVPDDALKALSRVPLGSLVLIRA
ncbi:lipoprotein-anchoring transpeptidase ErfK/SrfK [Actinomadura hallensis]|uniref:Lipoprotein-anchoring transpeptidase ErfK/SrfK n=1 Tax=Actinomadura hallensis TaxID=337895 RepID=A0A543I7Y2_9ACTN|nr:L,D-transpeptidase [Actinomadura hallensis]TQM66671.1 lipoprotein-anchoring transpeptidase ErfK/SrfK [Actinomadura hallensis]